MGKGFLNTPGATSRPHGVRLGATKRPEEVNMQLSQTL